MGFNGKTRAGATGGLGDETLIAGQVNSTMTISLVNAVQEPQKILATWNPPGNLFAAEYVASKNDFYPICKHKFDKKAGCRIEKGVKGPCQDCPSKEYVVLTLEHVRTHLSGKSRIGVYPLRGDVIYWCAADLDGHKESQDPHSDVKKFIEICRVLEIPLFIFSSNSGNGFHCYLFFDGPMPAFKARALMLELLERAGVDTRPKAGSFDAVFPKQDRLNDGDMGNLIALPWNGKAIKERNATLLLNADLEPYADNFEAFLEYFKPMTEAEVDGRLREMGVDPSTRKQEDGKETPSDSDGITWDGKVRSLPVQERIKTRILVPPAAGDRSEEEMSVLNALVKAGLSNAQILYIWETQPIGDRFRERGENERWMQSQIDKARAYKPNQKEPPRPLARHVPPAEEYPIDALGGLLGDAARAMNEVIQSPLAMCAQSVLAAAALAVQPYADITIDGRVIPLSGFFLTVASSGERKSATDDAALREHARYEAELQTSYVKEYGEFCNAEAAYKKAKDEALKKAKGYQGKKDALEMLGDPPVPPAKPVLIMQEPTFEGLVKAMLQCRPSIGIFSDEAGTFIGGHAMNEENRLKAAAGLSKLWDGKSLSRVRGGDGMSVIQGRRLSMHLMAQPNVAMLFLNDSMLIDQGLLSRFLATWPTSTAGNRPYKEADLCRDPAMLRYYERMHTTLRSPLPVSPNDDKQLVPPTLMLNAEAKTLWVEFHDLIESHLGDEAPLSPIRGFANKAPQHALRLAGILSLIEGQERTINQLFMENGIELAQYHISEALRLFHAGAVDPMIEQAQKLLDWITAEHFNHIDLPRIYQKGPSAIRDAKLARQLVLILADHGWLNPVDAGMEIDGKYRREVWEVVRV